MVGEESFHHIHSVNVFVNDGVKMYISIVFKFSVLVKVDGAKGVDLLIVEDHSNR